jgi:hypothetical protein
MESKEAEFWDSDGAIGKQKRITEIEKSNFSRPHTPTRPNTGSKWGKLRIIIKSVQTLQRPEVKNLEAVSLRSDMYLNVIIEKHCERNRWKKKQYYRSYLEVNFFKERI